MGTSLKVAIGLAFLICGANLESAFAQGTKRLIVVSTTTNRLTGVKVITETPLQMYRVEKNMTLEECNQLFKRLTTDVSALLQNKKFVEESHCVER